MGNIALVVFSLAVVLSIQFVVGQDEQTKDFTKSGFNTAGDATNSVKEMASSLADLELSPDQENKLNEEIKEAFESGDLNEMASVSLSPEHEEKFYHTILISTFMKMADDGLIDPEVVKNKLYPEGGKALSPEVKSMFDQIFQRAKTNAEDNVDIVKEKNKLKG